MEQSKEVRYRIPININASRGAEYRYTWILYQAQCITDTKYRSPWIIRASNAPEVILGNHTNLGRITYRSTFKWAGQQLILGDNKY